MGAFPDTASEIGNDHIATAARGYCGIVVGGLVFRFLNNNDTGPLRGSIGWDDPHNLASWYRRLIALRHDHSALRTPALAWIDVGEADQLLAYLRRPRSRERASRFS